MPFTYGQRFKQLRQQQGLTQEQVAVALKFKRPAPVSLIERRLVKPPRQHTIKRHAAALGCQPCELLAGVPTEYDWLRTLPPVPSAELGVWLVGLAYLSPANRKTVVTMMHELLTSVPAVMKAAPLQGLLHDFEHGETTARTPRKTRRA